MDGLTHMTILGMTATDLLSRIIYLGVVVIIALVVQKALVRGMHRAFDRSNLPSATIFINIMRGILWAIALLVVMQPVFGVSPTGFVAALGVGSVVISFGLQATVSNIVSGLGLMLGKVVQPGDEVTIGTFTGTVTDVTWRHTIVSMRNGTEQVIPNSVLNTSALTRRTAWDAGDCALTLYVRALPPEERADRCHCTRPDGARARQPQLDGPRGLPARCGPAKQGRLEHGEDCQLYH